MPVRTSTRQAAVKANQALSSSAAGSKRKASTAKGAAAKKERKDEPKQSANYQKPSVVDEYEEDKPMEAWSEERVQFEKAIDQDKKHEQETDQIAGEKEGETGQAAEKKEEDTAPTTETAANGQLT